jgi:diguanylate cyclase (GGDEF)-like protein/PAS domain S-box-containing protein
MPGTVDDLGLPPIGTKVDSATVLTNALLCDADLLAIYQGSGGDVAAILSTAGTFRHVSPACWTMLGWEPDGLVGTSIFDFVHSEDLMSVDAGRRAATRSARACVATCRFRCRDGGYLWTESVIRQVANPQSGGDPLLLMVSIRDVADRKLVEARLEHQALTDPLTGIANRTVLMDRLDQALRRLERSDTVLGVIYFDLDRFKVINDSLGHELGDRLLMKVAERALGCLRPADTLARIGGDEFVVLAEGLPTVEEAQLLATRVCGCIEMPFELDGESIICTASAGVATTTDFAHSGQGLLQEADLALYRAKDRGRNRAEVFDEELRTTAIGRLAIERTIRSAIDDDRLRVQYQPIVDLDTGHVARVEALVRIQERDRIVLPDDFIDIAEETGLLVTIDEYVLSQAVAQAAIWDRDLTATDFLGVAINVTGRHLADSRFVQIIAEALASNGLAPGSLAIEVTERVLMEASNSSMDCLRTIRELGVPVGLDDFGTGYSSLAYLRQFPLDFLKIDQSFVRQLLRKTTDAAIVTAIIDLAHALGLWVVAEGVETEDQLETLGRLGCDFAQGFYFSRADDPGIIGSLIDRRSSRSIP